MLKAFVNNCLNLFLAGFTPRRSDSSRWLYFFGGVSAVLIIGVFDLTFFNRYYPLAEGWFSVFARFMEHGFYPYRDFHLFLTPLYQLLICTFIKVFGYSMFRLRVFGWVLALIMTVFLYLLSIQFFEAPIALVSTVVGMVYYQSSVVFINYDFLQFVTVSSLAACWLICLHFRSSASSQTPSRPAFSWPLGLAGVLAGIAFLTKQSNGFFIALFLGISVILSGASVSFRTALRAGASFTLGILIPLAGIGLWLAQHQLWGAFVVNSLQAGAASKGGMIAILFGWIPRLLTAGRLKGLAAMVLLLGIGTFEALWKSKRGRIWTSSSESHFRTGVRLWFLSGAALLCILLPFAWVRLSYVVISHFYLNRLHAILPLLGTLFALLICVSAFYLNVVRKGSRSLPLLIVGASCAGLILGNGTSAAIDMAGAFLPVSLLIGFLLSMPVPARWSKLFVGLLGGVLLIYLCAQKYTAPYIWWGLSQADVRSTAPLHGIPMLEGMQVSLAQDGSVFLETIRLVEKYSAPGDTLYTFPHMAQFHLLTQRNPNTYAAVHWFDVASDGIAQHDAQILKISPPKVVIFLDIPDSVWREHERGFRGGSPSGQREIRRVLVDLIEHGRYTLVLKRWVPDKNVLTVWVRNDVTTSEKNRELHG